MIREVSCVIVFLYVLAALRVWHYVMEVKNKRK